MIHEICEKYWLYVQVYFSLIFFNINKYNKQTKEFVYFGSSLKRIHIILLLLDAFVFKHSSKYKK